MIRLLLLAISLLLFSACSFKSPPNQWQYKSSAAFGSYTKNFLGANDALASNDLRRAIKHAKQSADLTMLSRIYLGECALNISVGLEDKCEDYKNIKDIVNDKTLDAYYNFITLKLDESQLMHLDILYKDFALHLYKKEFDKANAEVLKISKPTSKLLAASLMRKNLSSYTREEIIKVASFHGYKKSVLFWLNEAKKNTTDENKRKNLSKKISILKSKY
ncbi:MAG: hypothetical protein U9P38_04800 [Campylobacterota bacterium]|nr:hypothetical protein [Campylobacterota bacterium]